MYDYGNARIAARRARLLDGPTLRRLADLGSAEAVLATLERSEDWRAALRQATPLFGDATAAMEAAIERQRGARLAALVGWYDGTARRLAEALVLGLDLDRVVAIVRRRRGGSGADVIGGSIVRGALLGQAALGEIARTPDAAGMARVLVRTGVLAGSSARPLAEAARSHPDERGGAVAVDDGTRLEEALVRAFDAVRLERAAGRGHAERRVRDLLVDELAERDSVVRELEEAGPAAAWLVERTGTLARLDRVARAGLRDPLGIGAVAGYVAAAEAEAIRLRAALARAVAGWSHETMAPFLAGARS